MAQPASMQSESGQHASLAARLEMRRLLEADRQHAGEARRQAGPAALKTAAYAPTLEQRWYAFRMAHWYWFHGAGAWKVRRGVLGTVAATVLGALIALGWGWLAPEVPRARATEPTREGRSQPAHPPPIFPAPVAKPVPAPVERAAQRAGAQAAPPPAQNTPPADEKLARMVAELAPRARTVRADVLLQHSHPVATRRARGLLESALADGARGAHLQSSLGEACLRLGDFDCAERAVKQAIRLRPWRGGYRVQLRRVRAAAQGGSGR